LASRAEVVNGRERRMYELTARGARALEGRRAAWREFAGAVDTVLGFGTT
jgi:PadR family transcriptional regulator PadR